MNPKHPLSYNFSRGSLVYFSWVALLASTILLICTLFNIPPYIDFGEGLVIGFSDYKYGIPVDGWVTTEIPQTSIAQFDGKERLITNIYADSMKIEGSTKTNATFANYVDTIRVQYTNQIQSGRSDITIPAARIDYMTFFVQPGNYFQKLLLSLPYIMLLFVIGFCCRQVVKLLDSIQGDKSFSDENYSRLMNIGWSIIGYQILLFITGLIQSWLFGVLTIDFISSIPNYRAPLELRGEVESEFNLLWLIGGCMLLVIAKTFKTGKELQTDSDLMI